MEPKRLYVWSSAKLVQEMWILKNATSTVSLLEEINDAKVESPPFWDTYSFSATFHGIFFIIYAMLYQEAKGTVIHTVDNFCTWSWQLAAPGSS